MGPTKTNVPVASVPVAGATAAKGAAVVGAKDVPVVATNAVPVVPAVPVKATAATPVVAVPVSTKPATLEKVVEVPKTVGVPKPVEILNESATPVDKVVTVEKIVRWYGLVKRRAKSVAGRTACPGALAQGDMESAARVTETSTDAACACFPVMCLQSCDGEVYRWRRRSLSRLRRSSMSSGPWR